MAHLSRPLTIIACALAALRACNALEAVGKEIQVSFVLEPFDLSQEALALNSMSDASAFSIIEEYDYSPEVLSSRTLLH